MDLGLQIDDMEAESQSEIRTRPNRSAVYEIGSNSKTTLMKVACRRGSNTVVQK